MKNKPGLFNMQNGPIMDVLDTFVFGPLNIIDRIGWVIGVIRKRSIGHRFKMWRVDKYDGDGMSHNAVIKLLKDRGVMAYGYTHDADYIYFSVSKRQAQWAEYILLRAGISEQLCNPTKQHSKNSQWANGHSGAPPAWKDKPSKLDQAESWLDSILDKL